MARFKNVWLELFSPIFVFCLDSFVLLLCFSNCFVCCFFLLMFVLFCLFPKATPKGSQKRLSSKVCHQRLRNKDCDQRLPNLDCHQRLPSLLDSFIPLLTSCWIQIAFVCYLYIGIPLNSSKNCHFIASEALPRISLVGSYSLPSVSFSLGWAILTSTSISKFFVQPCEFRDMSRTEHERIAVIVLVNGDIDITALVVACLLQAMDDWPCLRKHLGQHLERTGWLRNFRDNILCRCAHLSGIVALVQVLEALKLRKPLNLCVLTALAFCHVSSPAMWFQKVLL